VTHPERLTKNIVQYDVVKGKFDQKNKKFVLTTVDLVDLDFATHPPFQKEPILDPSQYELFIDNHNVKGRWITSNIDNDNVLVGELARIRNNGTTIYNKYLLPKLQYDMDVCLLFALDQVTSHQELTAVLVLIQKEWMKGKVLWKE